MKKILAIILVSILFITGCSSGSINSSNENNEEYQNEKVSIYDFWINDMENELELSDDSSKFIEDNNNLFPTNNKEEVSKLVDNSITYKHINKNIKQYYKSIIKFEGYVIDVQEEEIEEGNKATILHVADDNMQSYEILYLGELKDIFKEDKISVIGLPLGIGGFENTDGGYTNTIVIAGSYIEKLQ
ncbi:hypothetical protein CLPU_3c02580 [Gottschalkia purinilytica]|uniref:Lipoprotein n=1 Tax=Gottschalkia purinilytica TaxID=1503 RepID=A0A0L0WDD5_GOTPU|nr:hypothetical protein [Gottschalkia purinilytica]KNF09478.1 hypothetical protein CLPU_3c02580 [Gottschalkia purinilytica]